MSIDIAGKLASGKKLTDDEIEYASDRGIELPDEYDAAVKSYRLSIGDDGARPPEPVFQTGPAFAAPVDPGLFLSEDELGQMTKDQLLAVGDLKGVELSGTKAEMVAALAGTEAESEEDEG